MLPETKVRYERLISNEREHAPSSPTSNTVPGAAASDRSRVLFSAPFRRLQQKAQVFPLEDNSAVRSRLTHSLEVADIGRSIARKLTRGLLREVLDADRADAFVDIVETACLMHDIGNPPFGHFGEQAIQRWFGTCGPATYAQATEQDYSSAANQDHAADFLCFDGNPQGFRIVSRLQYGNRPGMNLTFSQLLAGIKYPVAAREAAKISSARDRRKKPGYFSTEESVIALARSALGMGPDRRHPLSYVMEAADDIAYCMSDIEDGFEKELLNLDAMSEFLLNECTHEAFRTSLPEPRKWGTTWGDRAAAFLNFKTAYSRMMIDAAVASFTSNHESILEGTYSELFPLNSPEGKVLKALKDLARKELFRNDAVENLELAGFSVISGMLDHYRLLLALPKDRFDFLVKEDWTKKGLDVEWRLYNRLPKKHLHLYKAACATREQSASQEWNLRAHLVVDYISGMTDRFAVSTYQLLSGVSIG